MITVSMSAQKHFRLLLSKEPKDTQIRVFVIHPGTFHAECGVSYCSKDEITELDIQFQYNNFYIYVHKSIIPYLKDAEIDLIVDKLGSQLTLKAPYSKQNIFHQKSSLEEDVSNFLNIKINPHLAAHRGHVKLIKITEENIAIIEFSGGCNGCSMISITLKEMIEKKLLLHFPQLKKISDKTDHLHGSHSFF